MAHTDSDNDEPRGIIQQKPPPPPGFKAPDGDGEPVDPAAPTDPQAPAPSAPPETPPQHPQAPRVASPHAPASRRRPPSGHIIIPARPVGPEIISRSAARPRMSSDPALLLIDYPRLHRPALTTVR